VVLLATREYEPRRGKRNGAGAKQRNRGLRRSSWRKARAGNFTLRIRASDTDPRWLIPYDQGCWHW